jgi:hypothetical protein
MVCTGYRTTKITRGRAPIGFSAESRSRIPDYNSVARVPDDFRRAGTSTHGNDGNMRILAFAVMGRISSCIRSPIAGLVPAAIFKNPEFSALNRRTQAVIFVNDGDRIEDEGRSAGDVWKLILPGWRVSSLRSSCE